MPPRRYIRVLSAFIHVAIVSALIGAQLFSTGPLPTPHTVLAFSNPLPVRIVDDIPLPPPPRGGGPASVDPLLNAAPIAPPSEIAAETGRENQTSTQQANDFPGVEAGVVGGIDLPGQGVQIEPPPPPPPPPPQPIRLRSGMQPPRKTVNVLPQYPAFAQSAHIEGVVILDAVIDATGRVTGVRVIRSLPMLDQAAIDAVRQWRFTPTMLNGEAVPILLTVTVQFKLGPS